MSLIVTVTVFMMFFSIVSSICTMEDSATLENTGSKVLKRIFLIELILVALGIGVSSIFFPIVSIGGENGTIEVGKVMELFLSVIPKNLLQAFLDANVMQILVIAFFVGIGITIIGNSIAHLKTMTIEANKLVFKIMQIVLSIIPLVIFLCILKTLSMSNFSDFAIVWRIVVAHYIICAIISLVMIIRFIIEAKMGISDFLKKISPSIFIAFSTGSSIATLPKNFEIAKNELHIEDKLCTFWLPLALALFAPSPLIEIIVGAFYVTQVSGGTISIMQLLIIGFLSIQLSIATPRVSGGMTASFTILLTQLGMPLELIGTLMIANTMTGNIGTAMNNLLYNFELFSISNKLNFVKSEA